MGLNERQVKAMMYVKEKGNITNKDYQDLTRVSKPMATIDLRGLVNLRIFKKKGVTGKGTEYVLVMANKGLMGIGRSRECEMRCHWAYFGHLSDSKCNNEEVMKSL